jgi:hypothetical protein
MPEHNEVGRSYRRGGHCRSWQDTARFTPSHCVSSVMQTGVVERLTHLACILRQTPMGIGIDFSLLIEAVHRNKR